jgi:hypothetical protein
LKLLDNMYAKNPVALQPLMKFLGCLDRIELNQIGLCIFHFQWVCFLLEVFL